MKISISTFVYFNHSLEDAVERIAACGYDGIEIWGGRPHAYRSDLSDIEIFGIRKKIESSGLEISAFIPAQFRYPTLLCSPGEYVRKDSVSYIKDSIKTALKFGCKKVSICPGHTLFGQGYGNGMKQLTKSVMELHDFVKGEGVILLIEPAHAFESDLIRTIKEGVDFINSLALDNVGIALDTGHCNVNGEDLKGTLSLLDRIPYHIHVDDNNGKGDDHKIPGEGNIDFMPFLKELRKKSYQDFLTIEIGWNYTMDPDAAALKSILELKSLIDMVGN